MCIVALLMLIWAGPWAAAQVDATSVRNHLSTGEAALAAGRTHEAEREFRAALDIEPGNADAQADLGAVEWMRGDCGTARQDLRKALTAKPSLINAEGLLGICEKRLGDLAADAHLEAAFARIPSAPLKNAQLRLEVGVELGDLYYQRGDLEKALPVVRELVALHPENVDILFFAQHIYQEMADNTLNKLALLAPSSARMQQVIAEHLVNAGDLAAAADHYRRAIEIDPSLPGVHFELGEAIIEAAPQDGSAREKGRMELETALRVDGESSRIECELGRVNHLQNQPELALAHYERAYALNPKEVEAQMGIGRILLEQRKAQQALRYLSEAISQDPLNAEAHYHYARALKALHHDEEAQQEMKLFETVRRAQNQVRELYRQMNKRVRANADEFPASEGSLP
jgi:tetratricopeptide (TPR) repeat protein